MLGGGFADYALVKNDCCVCYWITACYKILKNQAMKIYTRPDFIVMCCYDFLAVILSVKIIKENGVI